MNESTWKIFAIFAALAGVCASTGCSSSDASTVGDAGSSASASNQGFVTVDQSVSGGAYSSVVRAAFARGDAAPNRCTSAALGPACTFYACPAVAGSDAGATTTTNDAGAAPSIVAAPNAGAITVRGGSIPNAGLVLAPDATTGMYKDLSGTSPIFAGGASIAVSATGNANGVGAFSGTVTAPGDITLRAPTFDASRVTTFGRGSDLVLTWSGGTPGTYVDVLASAVTAATGDVEEVACKFAGDASSGTLPSAGGLARLPRVDGTSVLGSFTISPTSITTTTATNGDPSIAGTGDFSIEVVAYSTTLGGTFTTTD